MAEIRMMTFPCFKSLTYGCILLVSGFAHADFSISGKGQGLQPGSEITLLRQDLDTRNQTEEATLKVRADHTFSGAISGEAGFFNLQISGWGNLPLAIADGQTLDIQIHSGDTSDFSVKGSSYTGILLAYEVFRKESLARLVYPPRAELNKATAARLSPDKMAPLAQAEVDGYIAHKRELNDFTIEHAGTSVALYATSLRWDGDYRIDEIQKQVDAFAKIHPDLVITKSMQNRLRLFRLTAVGAQASPLSGMDLDGANYSLADFKGKVVLVDFWASWCGPCRVENRHYPKLLEKYSENGFGVFGINLDSNRPIWSRATQQDGVTWPQISDLQGLNSPMAKAYNVSALPVSFLLDESGKILAKNLRGEVLDRKLEELFEVSP
jgi:thiol-disulfide isomerase/thioredoxin